MIAPAKLPLLEWESDTAHKARLNPVDRVLIEDFGQGSKLVVDELASGVRVSARQWVGVVRLSELEVTISPRFVATPEELVELVEFATGIDALTRNRGQRSLAPSGNSLFDLIATLFLEAVERILRGGLRLDYVEKVEDLGVLRGRLELSDQLTRNFGRVDRLICRFDDQETDVIENQVLRAALQECARHVTNPRIARHARALFTVLAEVCEPPETDLKVARASIEYNRLNQHYRPAHELAWLIFEGLGVSDLLMAGRTSSFAFLLDMNVLFERFIWRLVESWVRGTHLRLHYQLPNSSVIRYSSGGYYAGIRPDLLLSSEARIGRVAIDAKYKGYSSDRISVADLSQAFLYAYAYSIAAPLALIAYPGTSEVPVVTRLEIRKADGLAAAQIVAVGINIKAALAEAHGLTRGVIGETVLGLVSSSLAALRAA
jgi:5-methylcytosine-specific restriction enzyme subunit McrC